MTCERVSPFRHWTLRADDNNHYHQIVEISDSPLYLEFSWRASSNDPVHPVGIFRLDLVALLGDGYIRTEPVGSSSSNVRVRIVRNNDCNFYIQANSQGPRLRLPQ